MPSSEGDYLASAADPLPRRSFLLAGSWFLLFIVYGSLVPLDFHPRPLDAAWGEFLKTPYVDLGLESRADWVANILLYIPLGFCFTAALGGAGSRFRSLMAGIAVFVMGAAVAVGIEFTQMFFPPRTVSLNDLVAELLGTAAGIAICWIWGVKLAQLAASISFGGPRAIRAAVTVYVLGYLGLSLFPYDFVVSTAELQWKLDSGAYSLFIARGACGGFFICGIKLAAEMAAVAPLGLLMGILLTRDFRRPYSVAFVTGLVLGAAIEVAQFFLASGISQGISVATRGFGLMLGIAAHRHATPDRVRMLRQYLRPCIALAAVPYVVVLMALNGWFDARWVGVDLALANLAEVRFLPFYYHYFTTETHAVRSFVACAAMYLTVGLGAWTWSAGGSPGVIRGSPWVAATLAAALAFILEAGKLFVPEHRPDPTNVLIAGFTAYSAYALATAALRWAGEDTREMLVGSQAPPKPPPQLAVPAQVTSGFTAHALSLPFVALALGFVLYYPFGGWLAAFLAAYAACLWRWPQAALPSVLALLPVLDLAPWSGWFFFDEFDAVLLVTVAVMLWRIPSSQWNPRGAGIHRWVVIPIVLSYAISALIGLLPLQAIDLNAFSGYYSHYNSLRTLKGFFWGLLLAAPTVHLLRRGVAGQKLLAAGMLLGLLGVSMAALWERQLFSGLLDFSADYRITATFSGMHTGGAFLEGYLVLAIPFLAAWAHLRRGPVAFGAVVALFGLASYALLVTFARGGYLGYAGALGIVGVSALLHALRNRAMPVRAAIISASLLATGIALSIPVLEGTYMQSRWATVGEDAGVRSRHWHDAIAMMDESPRAILFGMGLGRFPETYFYRNPTGELPATFRFEQEAGNVYLRLGAGGTLYYGQRVPVEPGRAYFVELDVRSASPGAELKLYLCEKSILYSQNCQSFGLPAKQANESMDGWTHRRLEINSGQIGEGPRYQRRPVELALTSSVAGTLVDVDNVMLFDVADLRNLVTNGDFSRGHDRWFFSADDHLPWHAKNLAVQILFEQGGFGLLAIGMAVVFGLARLAQYVKRGDLFSGVLLAALVGFLLVGLFDSLFDAPRLTLLFFLFLLAATAMPHPSRAQYS